MKPIIRYLCRVSSIALSVLAAISPAKSQIEADNTLPVNSQVTGCPICLIEGGTVRGGNLFHSFEEFSVPTGGEAFFDNALDIQNILGRVTGSTLSNIDGLILANGTANLFLINPNGIIFGENAQLDIGGSFVASTANAIGFGNQGVFSATEPEAPPLLTVNPDALFFNQLAAQGVSSIEVRGSLSVPLGESLLLVGGNIAPDATSTGELLIDGGTLAAFGGRVELAGVGAPGAVGLAVKNGSLGLDFPADLARTDISIFDSTINVAGAGGGDIVIYPRDLFIGNSQLLAGIFSGLGSVDAQAGDITIDATGTVVVAEGVISNNVGAGATGRGGDVRITASSLSVTNGAQIDATTSGEGDAGKVVIRATDSILLDREDSQGFYSGVFSTVASGAKGNSGGVEIDSGSLSVTNGAVIDATTSGEGDAGKIVIRATESILLDGEDSQGFPSGIFSIVALEANGNSGGVEIDSGSLTLNTGALIDASTFGEGDAGKIVIRANDSILLDGEDSQGFPSGVFSTVQPGAKGNSRGVEIFSASLTATNGARISATTFAEGDAGKIVIRATDSILLDGEDSQGDISGVFSTVDFEAKGDSGGVNIESGSLSATNGAQIDATTFAEGDAGKIVIRATDSILLDGEDSQGFPSGVFSTVQPIANGNSEGVDIDSGSLTATNGAQIDATTFAEGDAGKVVIRATDSILLDGEDSQGNRSGVFSTVQPIANGNSEGVEIKSGSLTVTNGTRINASTLGEGNAGKIVIRATDNVLLNGENSQGLLSGVFSTVESGAKGNSGGVNIESGSLTATNGAQIDATTFGEGDAGKIVIRATDTILLDGEDSQGFNSGVFSTVQPGAKGNSEGVNIDSGSLSARNGARISASTLGEGDAGKIVIRATDTILLDGDTSQGLVSGVFSTVEPGAKGNSEGVNIESGSLGAINGAEISAETRSDTRAGDVSIDAKDFIQLSGNSAIRASATTGGSAGNLDIITQRLSVEDGAQITVSSPSGQAGNLSIGANSLELNQGQVTAETGTSGIEGGANIRLQNLNTLLMTDESLISATAFEDANGGNININSIFLVALPPEGVNGSDIIANAQRGDGGRIIINGEGIFGIEERRAIPGNRTNDIDASSQFGASGEIQLNVPLDPARGLVELPGELVDVTRLVEQNLCQAAQGSSFIVTGRGGLPTPPQEPLNPEATWEDWRIDLTSESTANPTQDVETRHGASGEGKVHQQTPDNQPKRIIEAQGWYRDAKGTVILTAEPTTVTPHGTWLSSTNCSE
ncbi:MAG: filamentous hemagglutinin N-terminal domain-containing protein [Coleofasciculus chthonoplastes F3-SA18-01]|uniref:two-partner secretion domain-containing protein n=1 Tax=Coleofasciculus chthonoplastes TaxID=64178 RepID=UPI0033047C05